MSNFSLNLAGMKSMFTSCQGLLLFSMINEKNY